MHAQIMSIFTLCALLLPLQPMSPLESDGCACIGCAASANNGDTVGGDLSWTEGTFDIRNGQCQPDGAKCKGASCPTSGLVQITNSSGDTVWYRVERYVPILDDDGQPTTDFEWQFGTSQGLTDGTTSPLITFNDDAVACGGEIRISVYNANPNVGAMDPGKKIGDKDFACSECVGP